MMPVAFLGLGSNVDAERNLRLAARELRERFQVRAISPVYRSKPMGFAGADFLNAVASIDTELRPEELIAEIDAIHELAGRQRGAQKFVARTLDIDLLLYDQLVLDKPPIVLPRRDVLRYGFVLRPLVDIAADYCHPVTGRTVADHWREFDASKHPLTRLDIVL